VAHTSSNIRPNRSGENTFSAPPKLAITSNPLSESAEKDAVIEGLYVGETKILQMTAKGACVNVLRELGGRLDIQSDSTGTILTASVPI